MDRYLKAAYLLGIIGGVSCGFAFMVFYWLGAEPISFTEIFGYILIPIFVFLGIRNFKVAMNGGELMFGQGMTVGFFVYSILAFISAMIIFIMLHVDVAVFQEYKLANLTLLEQQRLEIVEQLGEESYNTTWRNISQMTIFDVSLNDLLRKLIPGLFFTIIISIILKNSNK